MPPTPKKSQYFSVFMQTHYAKTRTGSLFFITTVYLKFKVPSTVRYIASSVTI